MINNDRVEENWKNSYLMNYFLCRLKVNWDDGFEKSGKSLTHLLFKIFLDNNSHKMALKILLLDSLIAFVHPIELIFSRQCSVNSKNSYVLNYIIALLGWFLPKYLFLPCYFFFLLHGCENYWSLPIIEHIIIIVIIYSYIPLKNVDIDWLCLAWTVGIRRSMFRFGPYIYLFCIFQLP